MRLMAILLCLAGAANAQTGRSDAEEAFVEILSRSMNQKAPTYLRIAGGPCWEARIEIVDGDVTLGGGNGPAPRVFADQKGTMLLLDGESDQVGGASYMVLRTNEATTDPVGAILRPVAICADTEATPRCTGKIGGLRHFSLHASSVNFCE